MPMCRCGDCAILVQPGRRVPHVGEKDGLVNIGGFVGLNDEHWARAITDLLILVEGFPTYGGLAGRDLEAMARGLEEVLEEDYLRFRVGQVRYLAELLERGGVPILKPVGGIPCIERQEFLPHLGRHQFPAQALAVALYRSMAFAALRWIGDVREARSGDGQATYPERNWSGWPSRAASTRIRI